MSGFFEKLILLGALQGFILSAMLLFKKDARLSNRMLASLIFLMALASLNLYVTGTNWYRQSPIIVFLSNFIPMVVVMPMGPLIYFYVRSFSDPSFVFEKKYRIHFYSVIIDLVPYLTAIIYVFGLIFKWFPKNDAPWGKFIDLYNVYSDIPRWISLSIYLWISNNYLKSLKNKSEKTRREQDGHLYWLSQTLRFFAIFQIIWLCYLIPYVIPKYSNRLIDLVDWYPVYIPMSILIYVLGIKGYLKASLRSVSENQSIRKHPTFDEQFGQDIIDRLKKAMDEEKLWLDPALNLSLLTKHTGLQQKQFPRSSTSKCTKASVNL